MKPKQGSTARRFSRRRIGTPLETRRSHIAMTINRAPEELFAFWSDFGNLPLVMEQIVSVERIDDMRSQWRVRHSKDDHSDWQVTVVEVRPNELIAWRAIEGNDTHHACSIRFQGAPGGVGTEVHVELEHDASRFADTLAKLARRSPDQQMREDLRHFKQLMEAGEIPTTLGQPAARTKDTVAKYQEAR